ncbi:ATP-binding cassette domain-containing protein [Holdemanella biformis]|uniref:ATP-binding cassette domain-containing protein n=1 Tax=Holdemanella biformis TaxID=1735 RepID=UPI001C384ED7|nr:ABC transporter ATP-binding protein [Holdemanella biformis]MBV4132064.1 ABC transporter ATP-binding protein/permease [Holdemanella biformis]MBV4151815.1 ABC transporter ATP-binding protein/permease [Holdemanella biformis]
MFKLVQNHKVLYFISLILIVSYSVVDLLKSILMSYIFDDHLLDSILSLIVIVLIFLGVYLIVSTLQQYVVEVLKNKIRYSLNQNLYQSYASRNIESFQKKDSSEILNEFNNEVNVVIDNYVSSKLNVFSLTISLILGSLYIANLSVEILMFLLFCAFITILINSIFKNSLKKNQMNYLDSMKQWLCSIKNLCRCFNDIKILNLEKVFCDDLDLENKNLEQSTLKNNGFIKILTSINSFISQAMFFLTLLFGIVLIHYNRLTVGQLLGIAQASNMVIMPIVNYANLRNMIQSSKPVLQKLLDDSICSEENEPIVFDEQIHDIKIKHLSYSYGARLILDLNNLVINQGKKYLVIGKSGDGKSTFLDILTKQKKADGIYVNDKDLKDVQFSTYVDKFSYVNQNNDLLPFSFEQNITLGRKMSKYSLKDLVTIFNLESMFDKERDNLDFEHLNLSGGEKQRICLARAMYRNKKWLFLDEAFSAIDKTNSDRIHQFILSDPYLTVLSIEHKVTKETVSLYDKVLLFENKKIVSMNVEEYLNSIFYF